MKKVLIFSILVLFLGSLFALESDPSAVVGFVKINAPSNFDTELSLPLEVDGQMVSTVFSDGAGVPYITGGTNPSASDQIQELGTGATAWYHTGLSTWMGDFAVDVTRAYLAKIRSSNPTIDIYICGTVDNTTIVNYAAIPANFDTELGFREAGSVMVGNVGLVAAGFQGGGNPNLSDQIQELGTGLTAWYNGSVWIGNFALTPGKAYVLKIRSGHTGLASYSYPASGADNLPTFFPTIREKRPTVPTSRKNTNINTKQTIKERK
jgi:hypothetical protein